MTSGAGIGVALSTGGVPVGVVAGGSKGIAVGDAVGLAAGSAADGVAAGGTTGDAGAGETMAGRAPAAVSARSWSSVSLTVRCPAATVGVSGEGLTVTVVSWGSGGEGSSGVLVSAAELSGGAADVEDIPW
jgi:hypothetical protein